MPVRLTRTVQFQAEHHFELSGSTPAENLARFGAVTEPHRHDYRCEVTVSGLMDPRTGMVVDLGLLDRILAEEVLGPLAGQDLNRVVPPFREGQQPTCEALATWLFRRVAGRLPRSVRLESIRVMEDPSLAAECTGLD